MKVFVADPEVPWRVAESLTVANPGAVEEQVVASNISLHEYPAITTGRPFGRIWNRIEMFFIHVASCKYSLV